jgi:hypothetical protein
MRLNGVDWKFEVYTFEVDPQVVGVEDFEFAD